MQDLGPKFLVRCYFTLEELEYIRDTLMRERILSEYTAKQLAGLAGIGVKMQERKEASVERKLLTYIERGKRGENL
jgi:hypothetical protein